VLDVKVAPKFELWWDFKNPEQEDGNLKAG
jgi:hypothetical protein